MIEFFRLSRSKGIVTVSLFVVLVTLSFSIGRSYIARRSEVQPTPPQGKVRLLPPLDGLRVYKLNPVLWLPAPIVTDTNYVEYFPVDTDKLVAISLPYWLLLSYIVGCSVVSFTKKAQHVEP